MGPGLDGEVGLGVEPDAEDDDGEEAGDVARKLPILPLAGLTRGRRGAVEEKALGSFLMARACPAARPGGCTSARAGGLKEAAADHGRCARERCWSWHCGFAYFPSFSLSREGV